MNKGTVFYAVPFYYKGALGSCNGIVWGIILLTKVLFTDILVYVLLEVWPAAENSEKTPDLPDNQRV